MTIANDIEPIERAIAQASKLLQERRIHEVFAPRIATAVQRLNAGLGMLAEAGKKHLDIRLDFEMPAIDLTPPSYEWDPREPVYTAALELVAAQFHAAVNKAVSGGLVGRDRKLGALHRG